MKTNVSRSDFLKMIRSGVVPLPRTPDELVAMLEGFVALKGQCRIPRDNSYPVLESAISEFHQDVSLPCGGIDVTRLGHVAADAGVEGFPNKWALRIGLESLGYVLVGRRRTVYSAYDNKHTVYRKA
ncbi:MAG: hypothetical protein ACRCUH_08840 [Shewanella sp.]